MSNEDIKKYEDIKKRVGGGEEYLFYYNNAEYWIS